MSANEETAVTYTVRYCRLCGGRFVAPAGERALFCVRCQPPLPGLGRV